MQEVAPEGRAKRRQELDALCKIKKPSDIKDLTTKGTREDDHLQCALVSINGIEIEFMYYGNLGFLEYWNDSKKAFRDLLSSIDHVTTMELENMEDEEENEDKIIDTFPKFLNYFKTCKYLTVIDFNIHLLDQMSKKMLTQEVFLEYLNYTQKEVSNTLVKMIDKMK